MTSEEELKYARLAAFVDGEGTIRVRKQKNSRDPQKYVYSQDVTVTNTDVRLISWIVDNFGGKFPKPSRQEDKNWKDVYTWELYGKKSYKLIKKIREYLLIKREQADCAIELYEQISKWHYCKAHPMPEYKRKLADELSQRSKSLNKNGRFDEKDGLEITIKIERKDRTWDDYKITEEKRYENGDQ